MKIIIGLGNPGKEYQNNRHNVGHMFIDYLVEIQKSKVPSSTRLAKGGKNQNQVKIFKTDCFMNVSGIFVKKVISNFKFQISNLIIAHDDLDIPFGKFHIQFGVGPQLHNGLESIENHLKTKDFWRIRIGVDNRQPKTNYLSHGRGIDNNRQKWISGEAYVLHNFTEEESKNLKEVIFPKIFTQLELHLN